MCHCERSEARVLYTSYKVTIFALWPPQNAKNKYLKIPLHKINSCNRRNWRLYKILYISCYNEIQLQFICTVHIRNGMSRNIPRILPNHTRFHHSGRSLHKRHTFLKHVYENICINQYFHNVHPKTSSTRPCNLFHGLFAPYIFSKMQNQPLH